MIPRHMTVAGLDVPTWVDLFTGCHARGPNGLSQFAWPDGQCYLNQENITVQMFRLIQRQIDKVNTND